MTIGAATAMPLQPTVRSSKIVIWLALACTVVFWASAFAAIRVALVGYSASELTAFRLLVAALLLAVFGWLVPIRVPQRRDMPLLILVGVLGFAIYHLALNIGEQSVDAGTSSLIVATVPVFTALFAWVILGEQINLKGWAGLLMSLTGVAVISVGRGGITYANWGAVAVLAAALSQSGYFVVQKRLSGQYTPRELTTYGALIGAAFYLPLAWRVMLHSTTAPFESTLAAAYLGIFPTAAAYLTWSVALANMPAGQAASCLNAVPPLAILIAWLLLGELPTPMAAIGGCFCVLGVVLVRVGQARANRTARPVLTAPISKAL